LEKLGHTLDEQAATAWLLMHWLEGAPDPLHQENVFAFHWNRGRFTPMHRPARYGGTREERGEAPWALNVFTPWLRVPAFLEALEQRRSALAAREDELRALLAEADSLWLPVLANEEPLAAVTATADRQKEEIFQRLHEGDIIAFLDRPMVAGPGLATLVRGQEVAKRYWPTESDVDGVQAMARRYKARLEGDSIVFPRGKYAIDEDLIIPQGYALILLSGARITMAPGRNILCQGSLFVRGTKLNPVFIRPGGGAFGTLAMMGDGDTPSSISGLQISGGSGARINGVQHPGMVSIQDASSTRFKDCVFSAPAGEVAMFVQGGGFSMDDCTVIGARAEVREVEGHVRNSVFQGGTRGAGSGGLVANASRLHLVESRFWSIKGAAFDVGDGGRAVIQRSHFSQCEVAVSAADLAEVHISASEINGSRTALRAERRKPLYGGAKIFVYANTFQRNANERVADEHSSITDAERLDERVLQEVVAR
jgi:hypothetical protein